MTARPAPLAPPPAAPGLGDSALDRERALVLGAYAHGVTYLIGKSTLKAKAGSNWFRRAVLDGAYTSIAANTRGTSAIYHVPQEDTLQMAVRYNV